MMLLIFLLDAMHDRAGDSGVISNMKLRNLKRNAFDVGSIDMIN